MPELVLLSLIIPWVRFLRHDPFVLPYGQKMKSGFGEWINPNPGQPANSTDYSGPCIPNLWDCIGFDKQTLRDGWAAQPMAWEAHYYQFICYTPRINYFTIW